MTKERSQRTVRTWGPIAATCSFTGGIIAALLGGVLTASTWVLGAESHPWVRNLGTVLMALTIPLLIFAGCCMDWAERERKKPPVTTAKGERGSIATSTVISGAVLFCLIPMVAIELQAQQTIFNVPSTDVLDRGKVYAELDVSFKPSNSAVVSKFSSFVPRVVVGAGGRVEVGLNITGNVQPGLDTTTLVPAIKWKSYQGKDNGIAIVVGDHLYLPVRNRAYNAGNYLYAEISKTFKSNTRITAGGYDFTRKVVALANRTGGQFGFEQSLNKTVTLAADWFTGRHSSGYFTPGVVFKVGPKATGYAGYSIGNWNVSRGNHFFLLEVGYNFN